MYYIFVAFRTNSARNGIAIIMSEKAHLALIEWKQLSDHIVNTCFKSKFYNISVICSCTPTLSVDDRQI